MRLLNARDCLKYTIIIAATASEAAWQDTGRAIQNIIDRSKNWGRGGVGLFELQGTAAPQFDEIANAGQFMILRDDYPELFQAALADRVVRRPDANVTKDDQGNIISYGNKHITYVAPPSSSIARVQNEAAESRSCVTYTTARASRAPWIA